MQCSSGCFRKCNRATIADQRTAAPARDAGVPRPNVFQPRQGLGGAVDSVTSAKGPNGRIFKVSGLGTPLSENRRILLRQYFVMVV